METVILTKPVTIAGREVTEIALREPTGGDLRGLKLTDILTGSSVALTRLIPRISAPALTESQVAAMPFRDITALFGGVMRFLNDGAETETLPEA